MCLLDTALHDWFAPPHAQVLRDYYNCSCAAETNASRISLSCQLLEDVCNTDLTHVDVTDAVNETTATCCFNHGFSLGFIMDASNQSIQLYLNGGYSMNFKAPTCTESYSLGSLVPNPCAHVLLQNHYDDPSVVEICNDPALCREELGTKPLNNVSSNPNMWIPPANPYYTADQVNYICDSVPTRPAASQECQAACGDLTPLRVFFVDASSTVPFCPVPSHCLELPEYFFPRFAQNCTQVDDDMGQWKGVPSHAKTFCEDLALALVAVLFLVGFW